MDCSFASSLTLLVVLLAVSGTAVVAWRCLREARAVGQVAEAKFLSLIEELPVAVIVENFEGQDLYFNRTFQRMFRYGGNDFQSTAQWWEHVYPDLDPQARQHKILQHTTVPRQGQQEILRVACRDASFCDVALHRIDQPTGQVWIMIDITAYRRNEEVLQRVNEQLQTRLGEQQRLQSTLQELAVRDPLTSLFNRRYFNETMEREMARAYRAGYPLILMMLDIDHFKRVNDTYGHLAGDEILQSIARLLLSRARQEDIVCRFGGEEFTVVMPEMTLEVAEKRAESLRREISEMRTVFGDHVLQVTMSIGIAAFPEHGHMLDELIDTADHALYQAKNEGRNRVCTAARASS